MEADDWLSGQRKAAVRLTPYARRIAQHCREVAADLAKEFADGRLFRFAVIAPRVVAGPGDCRPGDWAGADAAASQASAGGEEEGDPSLTHYTVYLFMNRPMQMPHKRYLANHFVRSLQASAPSPAGDSPAHRPAFVSGPTRVVLIDSGRDARQLARKLLDSEDGA